MVRLDAWPEDKAADALAAELSFLQTLSALPKLVDLELGGGIRWLPRPAQRRQLASALESCLSRLTALTRLHIGLRRLNHFANRQDLDFYAEEVGPSLSLQLRSLERAGMLAEAAELRAVAAAEWRAVVGPAARMPGLEVLRVPLQANMADLAALTALTSLRVGALALPQGADLELGARVGLTTYPLPRSLRRLETHAPMSVRVAALLEPPPPLDGEPCTLIAGGRLWLMPDTPWVLTFDEGDMDEVGRLTSEAAAAMQRAAGVLGKLGFREYDEIKSDYDPGLCVWARTADGISVQPPAPAADGADAGHVSSWLRALAGLDVQRLSLVGLALSPDDMLGLARCMGGLQELDLDGTSYPVYSLPLLAGMRQLRSLYVSSRGWGWPAQLPRAVECSFLALTAAGTPEQPAAAEADDESDSDDTGLVGSLPRLALLHVRCPEHEHAALDRALAPARRELERRGTGAELVLEQEE